MEELKNVINFDIPKEKKIQKKKDSDNRKYIVLPISILKHKLTGSELKILFLLGSYVNKAGITWVSQKRLAKEINTTRQYINNNIAKLKKKGIIDIIRFHVKGERGQTIRIIYNKDDNIKDVISNTSDKETDTRHPKVIEQETKEAIESPYQDYTNHTFEDTEQLQKNRKYSKQLLKVVNKNNNIRMGGLNRLGDAIDKNELNILQTMIKENMKKEKAKKSKPKAKKVNQILDNDKLKSNSLVDTGQLTDCPNIQVTYNKITSIDNIYNKYNNYMLSNGYATKTIMTEDDLKASELLIESGLNEQQLQETLQETKEYKPLIEILLQVSNKYTF